METVEAMERESVVESCSEKWPVSCSFERLHSVNLEGYAILYAMSNIFPHGP